MSLVLNRSSILLLTLAGFFIANAIVAEFMGVKIFSLEETLGFASLTWTIFGVTGSLQFTAGVLLWPVVFTLTDVINEYYGQKVVRRLSWLTVVLICYAFLMIYWAIGLSPASWWVGSYSNAGVPDAQQAYAALFGQGLWIIFGSVVAFLIGQVSDAYLFYRIKKRYGSKRIWLRALVSTLFSQLIDSFVVLYIAFVLGPQHWPIKRFLAVAFVNYGYKFILAVLLLPVLYGLHALIERYLGMKQAAELRLSALD
jgi:uncharacterized integral membrane protein (TIGR00697 family)